MKIMISEYGTIISNKELGEKILNKINSLLSSHNVVYVDFKDVLSMATFNAKQIFGTLYNKLGSKDFFTRLEFLNVNDDIKIIIRMGIEDALETV